MATARIRIPTVRVSAGENGLTDSFNSGKKSMADTSAGADVVLLPALFEPE